MEKLRPTPYARRMYGFTKPVDFEVAMNYGLALMVIAGSDGELADGEMQWYLDEQALMLADSGEYIDALREVDWTSVELPELLRHLNDDFPLNVRRSLLYQAIKMCRADGEYHERERATIQAAAKVLSIEPNVLASLEALAELEDSCDRLRLSLLETHSGTANPRTPNGDQGPN